jgi:ferredoxin
MGMVDSARLMLTQCRGCLGCNRLEDDNFRGDDKCKSVIQDKTEAKDETYLFV